LLVSANKPELAEVLRAAGCSSSSNSDDLFWRAAAGVGGGESPKSDMVEYAARVRDEGAQGGTRASRERAGTRSRQYKAGQQARRAPLHLWGSSRHDAYHAVRARKKRHYHRHPLPSSNRQRIPCLVLYSTAHPDCSMDMVKSQFGLFLTLFRDS
jgi:hypothetical protein